MRSARAGKKIATVLFAAALSVVALAVAPAAAHADGSTRVAVVQGTAPIGSEEELEGSLEASGYAARVAVGARSGDAACAAPSEDPPCGALLASPVPEGPVSDVARASAQALDDGRSSAACQVGDVRTFYANGREAEGFACRVAAVGARHTIWIEEGCDLFSDEDLERFTSELDAAIETVFASFGTADRFDRDGDGKVAFVFHGFGEALQHAGGYFWSGDLYSQEQLERWGWQGPGDTNHLDMLHLNTVNSFDEEGRNSIFDLDSVMPILVHELQHLVNHAQTEGNQDQWLSEAFSQAAEAMTGYGEVESARISYLYDRVREGVGTPFVFEGSYVPQGGSSSLSWAGYAQWYLFSRYLANQTEGFESPDGSLRGGDGLYLSVLDCERDARGFGACTKERLLKVLEAIGYLGKGEGRVVEDFDGLLLNYNAALLVRDKTGPYSLTNDASADPSLIDGAWLPLLEVHEGEVPAAVHGAGAALYIDLARAEKAQGQGEGVRELVLDAPLPLAYDVEAFPDSGGPLRDGALVSFDSPQLDAVSGSRLEYCALTCEDYDAWDLDSWEFQECRGPVAFDADKPVFVVRFACDRGATFPFVFGYEVDASEPEGDSGSGDGPGGQEGSGALPPAVDEPPAVEGGASAASGSGAPVDDRVGRAAELAPLGDPLAFAPAIFGALAVLGASGALAAAASRFRRGG